MKKSGLPDDVLLAATWDRWEVRERWQQAALDLAQKFVGQSIQEPGAWLYIGGPPGAGKTKLCSTIFRALVEGGVCKGQPAPMYLSWRDFSRKVKSVRQDEEKTENILRPAQNASVLYLDDLFKAAQSSADVGVAFDLINARYQNPRAITLVSCEITLDRLIYADEAVGSRIAERAQGFILDVTGAKNYRLRGGGPG